MATWAVRRYDPFELDLRTKPFDVPMDQCDRELLAPESIRYSAISTLERPIYLGFVPVLSVSNIGEAEIVLFGPEEWNVIEGFTPAENIVRCYLALALGDNPMFDANSLTGQPIRPSRDITGSEDARDAAFEVLIDDNAAIDLEPCLFR
jgi:hypothetical protein